MEGNESDVASHKKMAGCLAKAGGTLFETSYHSGMKSLLAATETIIYPLKVILLNKNSMWTCVKMNAFHFYYIWLSFPVQSDITASVYAQS